MGPHKDIEGVELTGEIIHETDMAIQIDTGDKKIWVPKSVIERESRSITEFKCEVPEWFAIERGII